MEYALKIKKDGKETKVNLRDALTNVVEKMKPDEIIGYYGTTDEEKKEHLKSVVNEMLDDDYGVDILVDLIKTHKGELDDITSEEIRRKYYLFKD